MSDGFRFAGIVAVALVVKLLLECMGDGFVRTVFQVVPANLAAGYWGVPLEPGTLTFSVREVTLEVTRACAGTDFFALALALFVFSRFRWFAPFIAWGVTVLANAIRLVLLVPVDAVFAKETMPMVHLGAGAAVFMPALIGVWFMCRKEKINESRRES